MFIRRATLNKIIADKQSLEEAHDYVLKKLFKAQRELREMQSAVCISSAEARTQRRIAALRNSVHDIIEELLAGGNRALAQALFDVIRADDRFKAQDASPLRGYTLGQLFDTAV